MNGREKQLIKLEQLQGNVVTTRTTGAHLIVKHSRTACENFAVSK